MNTEKKITGQTKFYLIVLLIILGAVIVGALAIFLLWPAGPLSPHGGNGIMMGPHGETPPRQSETQGPSETYSYNFSSTNAVHNAQMRYGLNLRAVKYLWDFGDGQTSTESNTTHQYKAPGAYTVKLTVTLEDGNIYTETTTITVK